MSNRLSLTILFIFLTTTITAVDTDTTKWYNKTYNLQEVKITKKRTKYSRKNNPAVELMRKVIANKRLTDVRSRDYCKFDKYQKLTLALNEVTPHDLEEGIIGKLPGALNQVEVCEYNNKMILPLVVTETVTKYLHSKEPSRDKQIIVGERSEGIGQLFQTGDILNEALKDFFTDINIYDNQIRLLHQSFTSPIGKDAIAFYRFFIVDTLNIDKDRCIHLVFSPNNPQDFGFSGELYILDDNSYQVRRCELAIPKKSGVNFVEGIKTLQEFTTLSDGSRVLTIDDMIVEMCLYDFLDKAIVVRNTRLSDYNFNEIADETFSLRTEVEEKSLAKKRSEEFWYNNRKVRLTGSEAKMGQFVSALANAKGFLKYVHIALKLLLENFIETGSQTSPSKFDIGPVNTIISNNFIDGYRFRIGGQTTANLCPQLFMKGYYAHGFDSGNNYYDAELTYSFNSKEYLPQEYPLRNITISSSYDVCSPTDKFLITDKDNVFTSFKWTTVDQMMYYHRHQIKFEREEYFGLRTTLNIKFEKNEACGNLNFKTFNTTELRLELRYVPGEKIVNSKQRRHKLNHEAPEITLSHTLGIKTLGGDYRYNLTEVKFYKRIWMKSWGRFDINLKGGIQWNKVPFPLLIMPAANLSYISQVETFSLINQMEFLNDRYASLDLAWDMNGKIFNRIPLIKKLKWREYIGFRTLWGDLSDKNNPYLPQNTGSDLLMTFPEGSNIMNSDKPYCELSIGIHNIFRFFQVEYARRLNYLNLPTAHKQGIRFRILLRF